MPMRSPPPLTKVEQIDDNQVRAVIQGLLSPDPVELKATVYRHLHPYATLDHQLVKAEGRWEIWKILQTNATLFDTRHKVHNVYFDATKLGVVALVDQFFRPRIPLRGWILPEFSAPTVVGLKFAKEPDQGLLIKELVIITSTDQLFGVPLLRWTHESLFKPLGTFIASTISDGIQFGIATRAFAAKQFNI